MLARLLELFNIHFKKNTKIILLCIEGLLATISFCRQIMELRPEGVFGYYAVTVLGILFIACYLGAIGSMKSLRTGPLWIPTVTYSMHSVSNPF